MELAKFCYNNLKHLARKATPFQMVTSKSPIMLTTWTTHGQTPSDANDEVLMVTQFDEERQHLWEMVKANLEKVNTWYKDFVDKFR